MIFSHQFALCNRDLDSYILEAYKTFENQYYTEFKQSLFIYDTMFKPIDSIETFVKTWENSFIKIAPGKLINLKLDSVFVEINLLDSVIIIHKVKGNSYQVNPIMDYLEMVKENNGRFELIRSFNSLLEIGLKLDTIKKPVIKIIIDTVNKTIREQSYYTILKRKEVEILVYCRVIYTDLIIDKIRKLSFDDYLLPSSSNRNLLFSEKYKKFKVIHR